MGMSEQDKREKVIKGLEEVIAEAVYPDRPRKFMMSLELAEAALALLKAQEPRVMAAEDIRRMIGAPVWLETQSKRVYSGWALVYEIQTGQGITGERMGITQPSGRVSWFLKIPDYGKTWRLWTDKPSNEKMEATPWQG